MKFPSAVATLLISLQFNCSVSDASVEEATATEHTIANIWKVWQQRQNTFDSFHVEFSADYWIEKSPRQRMAYRQPNILCWQSGSQRRIDRLAPITVDTESKRFVLVRMLETFNEGESVYFAASGGVRPRVPYHMGTIGKSSTSVPSRDLFLGSFVDVIRPIGPERALQKREQLTLVSGTSDKANREEVVVRINSAWGDPQSFSLVICRARDYLPAMIEHHRSGRLRNRIRYEYPKASTAEDVKKSPVAPISWHREMISPEGQTTGEIKFTRVRLDVGETYPESLFTFKFPPGTKVSDTRSGREETFLVQPDGDWLPN